MYVSSYISMDLAASIYVRVKKRKGTTRCLVWRAMNSPRIDRSSDRKSREDFGAQESQWTFAFGHFGVTNRRKVSYKVTCVCFLQSASRNIASRTADPETDMLLFFISQVYSTVKLWNKMIHLSRTTQICSYGGLINNNM